MFVKYKENEMLPTSVKYYLFTDSFSPSSLSAYSYSPLLYYYCILWSVYLQHTEIAHQDSKPAEWACYQEARSVL